MLKKKIQVPGKNEILLNMRMMFFCCISGINKSLNNADEITVSFNSIHFFIQNSMDLFVLVIHMFINLALNVFIL